MLPDYLIYDELKRRMEQEELERDRMRPRLEVPRYIPYWPEEAEGHSRSDEKGDDDDVIIIRM